MHLATILLAHPVIPFARIHMTGVLQNPSVDSHVFGLDTSAMNNNKTATDNSAGNVTSLPKWTGVHNVNYRRYHDTGTETVTIFVNGIDGTASSWVYEFENIILNVLRSPQPMQELFDVVGSSAPVLNQVCVLLFDQQSICRNTYDHFLSREHTRLCQEKFMAAV